jgi:predicted O-methyltransferase YrrM
MTKIGKFFYLSREVGIRLAIRYSLRWVKLQTNRPTQKKGRLESERKWIRRLADHDNLTAAEIGVRRGKHAAFLIDSLDIEKLYLIDPYEAYDEYSEDWADDDAMTEVETAARERLGSFKFAIFIQKFSNDAIPDISEDLDFVYIDGNHEYEFVKDDIANYYPLLNEGGILAGHNYTPGWPGVIQAVDEFARHRGLKVQRAKFADWFITKPTTG